MEGGTFEWPGAGQIYSSSRDMATFLAANLGELPDHRPIENAMTLAQQPVFTVNARLKIGLAWQNVSAGNFTIIDKNGGLQNTSTYIGFAPQQKLGVVFLSIAASSNPPELEGRSSTLWPKTSRSPQARVSQTRTTTDAVPNRERTTIVVATALCRRVQWATPPRRLGTARRLHIEAVVCFPR